MDKTFNDLMDIVNRTKKIDGGNRPRPRPSPRVTEVYEEEEYAPREYDIVEEAPKKKRTVKKDSPSLFAEESAIGKLLDKTTPKKSTTKKTTKASTTKKSSTTKSTTTKKAPAKSTATKTAKADKPATPKVSKPKLTKEDILSEIKVVKDSKKITPKKETPSVDTSDPKNAQLYAALHSSLFSGGTDISEYMEMDNKEMNETQNTLQELRAKREAQKINDEITKEQQEYEQLFNGSFESVYGNPQAEKFDEEEDVVEDVEEKVNVAEKNAQLQSELNEIRANLENKKNAPAQPVEQPATPVQERKVNSHDATFELDTGNRDLDKKIAEYYRRKQEKINQYKASMEDDYVEEEDKSQDDGPVDYEAIFGGSMMTRDELLGIEREPEEVEDNTEEVLEEQLVQDATTDIENTAEEMVEEEPIQEELVVEENATTEDVEDEEIPVAEEVDELSLNVEETEQNNANEETEVPVEESVIDIQETDENTQEEVVSEEQPVENKEDHIKSLLSDLLFSKKKNEENDSVQSVEEVASEEQATEESAEVEEIDNSQVAEQTEEERRADYESIWNGTLANEEAVEQTEEDAIEEVAPVEEKTAVEEVVEEDPADNMTEDELLDSLTLNIGGFAKPTNEDAQDSTIEEATEEVVDDEELDNQSEEIASEEQAVEREEISLTPEVEEIEDQIQEEPFAQPELEQVEETVTPVMEEVSVEETVIPTEDQETSQTNEFNNIASSVFDVNMTNETVSVENSVVNDEVDNQQTLENTTEVETTTDNSEENAGFVLIDTPQIFGDFDENNPQEMTPYVDRSPVQSEAVMDSNAEEVPTISESFEDEENLGINLDDKVEEDVYNLSDSEDMSDYILSSNVPTDEAEENHNTAEDVVNENATAPIADEYDEHFESMVTNERAYENTGIINSVEVKDDEEDNTYVVDTLPERRYDILGNEIKSEEDEEEKEEVVEDKKEDTISKEEFYNEMARLQENLINQLKGNAQTEGRDFFEEKKEDIAEDIADDIVDSVVDELLERFGQEMPDAKDEEEVVEETKEEPVEIVVPDEEVVCTAEPVDPEHFDDYDLLGKDEPLNEEDLAFQEKSEEEKVTEKDACFYASPEDNEKKSAVVDEFMDIYNEQETPKSEKEVGDINIFKNIGNATPSSEILKEVIEQEEKEDKVENKEETSSVKEEEVEAIYTLMGISRKPVSKPKEDMKVLYVASECQPFVASGGLGDVAGSLPKAIAKKGGVDIRVIMPLYGNIKQVYRDKFEYLGNFTVHLSWRQEYCGLFRYYMDGVTYYFIDNERYFKREKLYGYYDDGERFAYFSKAIVEALPHLNFFPDIIHCNDWQSSLVSAYIKTGNWSDFRYYKIKNIYTIHNVEYQGVYGMENLKDLFGIDFRFKNDMEYNGDINLTKAAIQYSDKFTTVSHSYCDNLKQPYCSRGLHHIIIRNEYKLSGIINGIDYEFYNPATDKSLFKNYDFGCIEEKVLNKKSWQDELGLPVDGDTPMISIVSRLVGHKGLDLVTKIIENTLQQDIQLVVVGTGDQKYVDYFKYLEGKYPTKVRALVDQYSNENARRAYAASDIFVMPSKIEPCGISQMIASRYGSVPIVREVGGLKDTITDFGCEGGGNGYTFTNYNPNDLSYQLNRAIKDYGNKAGWREKMKTIMSIDFTWNKPADDYIKLYKSLCD